MQINHTRKAYPISSLLEELHHDIPLAIDSFLNLSTAALQNGALDKRVKGLIALAIAIIQNSPECIAFHLQSLVKQELSYTELLELVAVATYMGGGPALMAGSEALTIFKNLCEATNHHDETGEDVAKGSVTKTKGYEA